MLTHELIICTRNRPDDLAVAIATVESQSRPFDSVMIVDSSDTDASERITCTAELRTKGFRYVRSRPGLTVQRNVGVRHSSADVIHFVDDDVLLDDQYLEALASTFEGPGGEDVIGAGGLITNLPDSRPRLWWRMALMDSRRHGIVLSSGINIMVTSAERPVQVEWLSGCSMSFRRKAFDAAAFDETLTGYGLMEDVDFSLRVSRSGRLVVNPAARLVHSVSPIERWDFERRTRASIYRRGWFVEKNLGRRDRFAFWWSVATGVAINVGLALCTKSRWKLRIAAWQARGAIDFFRGMR